MSRDTLPHEESIAARAIGIVRRRLAVAIVAFAAVIAAAAAFALYLPDLYRAQTIVLVERPLGDTLARPGASDSLESRLYVIQQTILSRDRLMELIARFDLYPELRARGSWEDALNQARQDIRWRPNGPEQVSGRTKTVTFTLSYTGDDQGIVADVTNAVAGFYVDYNNEMRTAEAQSATEFIRQQLEAARAEANGAQQKLNAFVTANQSQLPQAASVNAVTYTRLGDDLRRNREQQRMALEGKEKLEVALAEAARAAASTVGASTTAVTELGMEPSREFSEIAQRLEKAREDLIGLERRGLAAAHPEMIATRAAIDALEGDLDAQRQKDLAAFRAQQEAEEKKAEAAATGARATRTRSIEWYDAELARLAKEEQQIQTEMNRLLDRFDTAPAVQQQYLLLQREYEAAKSNYDVVQRRYDEARQNEIIETSGQGERFRVLEAALPPEGPAAPNRPRLLLMGFLLALAAAAAAIILREQFDTSFHTVDDVREFTAVPVLATIPQMGKAPRRGYARLALGTVSAVAVIVLAGTLSAYIAHGNETIVRMLQRAG